MPASHAGSHGFDSHLVHNSFAREPFDRAATASAVIGAWNQGFPMGRVLSAKEAMASLAHWGVGYIALWPGCVDPLWLLMLLESRTRFTQN